MATCKWPLGDGTTLEFTIYDPNTQWNKVAGLYIFAYKENNNWSALYVGQTDDFSVRLPSHEKWDSAVRKGATHIHAVSVSLAANRDKWEEMLIGHLRPPMNDQLK
jgi:hypothetical protein